MITFELEQERIVNLDVVQDTLQMGIEQDESESTVNTDNVRQGQFFLCGSTSHFTDFGVFLQTAGGSSSDDSSSALMNYIWILVVTTVGFAIVVVVLVIVAIRKIPGVRRMAMGLEGLYCGPLPSMIINITV